MFRVKEYDLGDQKEFIGFYPEVLMQEKEKKRMILGESKKWKKDTLTDQQKQIDNRLRSVRRAKTEVRRKVLRYRMRYMWTLTFASQYITIRNRNGSQRTYDLGLESDAWELWKIFLKRCHRVGLKFPYIATIELQEKRLLKYGERVYHFHFATNMYIPQTKAIAMQKKMGFCLEDFWDFGFVKPIDFGDFSKKSKVGPHVYLTKYIMKAQEGGVSNRQSYRVSEGLTLPFEVLEFEDHRAFVSYVFGQVFVTNYKDDLIFADFFEIWWAIGNKKDDS